MICLRRITYGVMW